MCFILCGARVKSLHQMILFATFCILTTTFRSKDHQTTNYFVRSRLRNHSRSEILSAISKVVISFLCSPLNFIGLDCDREREKERKPPVIQKRIDACFISFFFSREYIKNAFVDLKIKLSKVS